MSHAFQRKTKYRKRKSNHKSIFHFPSQSFVVKHRKFLERLYKTAQRGDRNHLQQLISSANKGELKALCESAYNLLRGSFPKTNLRFLRRLIPFKKILRQLSCKKNSNTKIRRLLLNPKVFTTNQKGGIFPIGALLAPIVGSLIASAI